MLTEWLVRKCVARPDDVTDPRVRGSYGSLEGWTSVVVNLLVFGVKVVPGFMIGSISLIADAFHSLGDVASSGVVIWGFKVAAKPSDREHPFGHGRLESVATLVIALMLVLTAWEFGKASVDRLLHPKPVTASWLLLVVLAASLVLKEWLSQFSLRLGKRIDSSALVADFWHHRSDVLATAVVIAALFAGRFGLDWIDGAAGLVVAGFIGWAAIELVRASLNPLIGEAPSPKILQEMREAALSVPDVLDVHDLVVHRYGELAVTSLHVEIPADVDVMRAHEIAETVQARLTGRFAGQSVVHVDPVDRNHPLWPEIAGFLKEAVPTLPGAQGFHDLRIVGTPENAYVILDLSLEGDGDRGAEVVSRLRDAVAGRFPNVERVIVNVEPRYVY